MTKPKSNNILPSNGAALLQNNMNFSWVAGNPKSKKDQSLCMCLSSCRATLYLSIDSILRTVRRRIVNPLLRWLCIKPSLRNSLVWALRNTDGLAALSSALLLLHAIRSIGKQWAGCDSMEQRCTHAHNNNRHRGMFALIDWVLVLCSINLLWCGPLCWDLGGLQWKYERCERAIIIQSHFYYRCLHKNPKAYYDIINTYIQ